MSDLTDKLMNARCRLMINEPFYGHIAMSMTWVPSYAVPTMGVCIVNGGEVKCIYNPDFTASLSIEELYFVVQHEIEHVVRVHCLRVGDRDREIWNIACDMTVNGLKSSPRIGYHNPLDRKPVVPIQDELVWIPTNWPDDQSTEYYYDKLIQNANKCSKCDKKHVLYQQCGCSDSSFGKLVDDHDIWQQSDTSEDEARQVIKDLVDQSAQKSQGRIPSHLTQAVANLAKPIIRWRELLKHYIGKHVGTKRFTYSRRNRRRDEFGLPGISHHAAANVVVIVDTSGSISQKELQQFFAEIDAISARSNTFVLQWDCVYQGYSKYRRGDWKKFQVAGRGGTDMAAPIMWLKHNRKVPDVTIMLTDGETNWIKNAEVVFPVITVITRASTTQPDYGHVVRMAF